jgi:hypothetical protein
VTEKSRVVTFRMDQATWDFMRELVPYTKYRKASSFIREGISSPRMPVCVGGLQRTSQHQGPGEALLRKPRSVTNSRRFTARCLPCFRQKG